MHRLSPFPLLRTGFRTVRRAWLPLLTVMLAFQLVMLVLVSPLLAWIFREALRANGMLALDFTALHFNGTIGITLALIVVIMLLAFWIASLQFIVLVLMLRRAYNDEAVTTRTIWADVKTTMRKLVRPSSFSLFVYLFFILPLSGFGFASTLSQGIAVPSFISGELMKSPGSAAVWTGFLVILALLNLRYALSVPIFVLTNATGGKSMRQSWRLTRGWAAIRLAFATLIVLFIAGLVTIVLTVLAILPTALSDEVLPAASPAVAAFSLGIAQLIGMLLTGFVVSWLAAVLLVLVFQREDQLAPELLPLAGTAITGTAITDEADTAGLVTEPNTEPAAAGPVITGPLGHRRRAAGLFAGAAVLAIGLGFFHLGTMQQLSQHPDTLVLGHRGFSDGGAENTISGLEAAVVSGADLVEIDVMQTADKKFVVMHDSSLSRLAGKDVKVKDLTLNELTAITVRDQFGHSDKIPSLETYITRAQELEMPLLIEVKSGGLDTPDRVSLLVDELESLGAMQQNIFHTLDKPVVQELKTLRPDATVGYILAFAGVDIPQTDADFVVVEQWSATQAMQDAAYRSGYAFFSWTVNDEAGIRELLRRDADGIITDHPDIAVTARDEMQQETGLAGTLVDAMTRFVVVF